ncbi:hypothetical protein [Lentzea nigeriaca]|uniref:hypothetical protein n=1 Tax=Lentzea nigeriaca TaxID=1128665 RepID=UPI0019569D56|nr:hypothetical protein [Lentzea nigeriaca]MBM7861903.1 hypothetical protein [Lentzea nigeriaca]
MLIVAVSDVAPGARGAAWLLLVACALVYMLACWVFPFRKCPACKGLGCHHGGFGGVKLCKRCDGDGLKLRAGRRVVNAIRRHRNRLR